MTFYIILYLVLTVSGLVLLKSGLAQTQLLGLTGLIKSLLNLKFLLSHLKFVLGILCYGLSFITWMFLLSKKDLSNIYPLTVGIVYALIMAASVVFFHEQFTLYKIIGVVLIGLGILFLLKQDNEQNTFCSTLLGEIFQYRIFYFVFSTFHSWCLWSDFGHRFRFIN